MVVMGKMGCSVVDLEVELMSAVSIEWLIGTLLVGWVRVALVQ